MDPITKTSHIFATCVIVWDIRMDLYNLFFRFKHLMISCFSQYLWAQILRSWRGVFENEKKIFPRMGSYTKIAMSFVTPIMIQEIQYHL
jgi:hypothetical protein